MTSAAFFDLDKTLIEVNSGRLWFQRERAEGRLPLHHALEAMMWGQLYNMGLLHGRTALQRAVRGLKGQEEAVLAERTRHFYEADVVSTIAPGARAVLDQHRACGEALVLLTSASIYLAELVREELGLDHSLAMEFEVEDGRFTGDIRQLCFGAAKVDVASAWAEEHGIDLGACSFYTDSASDLPMLERVCQPHTVQPDPRLARIAKRRGWPILDWSGAGAEATATPSGEAAAHA